MEIGFTQLLCPGHFVQELIFTGGVSGVVIIARGVLIYFHSRLFIDLHVLGLFEGGGGELILRSLVRESNLRQADCWVFRKLHGLGQELAIPGPSLGSHGFIFLSKLAAAVIESIFELLLVIRPLVNIRMIIHQIGISQSFQLGNLFRLIWR